MIFENAKTLLKREYEKYYNISSAHAQKVMNEKTRHSYQVLGVGNYLLKHEACFNTASPEEVTRLKATVLLHDIGRFYEVYREGFDEKVDHGEYGAQLLETIPLYKDIRITLPIKHHGHLIKNLYKDETYIDLDATKKKEIEKIIYLVRDSDKIANFYLLSREFPDMEELFFFAQRMDIGSQEISQEVWHDFLNHTEVNINNVHTAAENALMILACAFDIRYISSYQLLQKTQMLTKLYNYMKKFWTEKDAEICWTEINHHIKKKLSNL